MSASTFSDIQCDLHHLKHLVDTFTDMLIEMDREGLAEEPLGLEGLPRGAEGSRPQGRRTGRVR